MDLFEKEYRLRSVRNEAGALRRGFQRKAHLYVGNGNTEAIMIPDVSPFMSVIRVINDVLSRGRVQCGTTVPDHVVSLAIAGQDEKRSRVEPGRLPGSADWR